MAEEAKKKDEVKQDVLMANRIIRLVTSPNKAVAIEKSVLGNIAGSIMHAVTKIAATEGFNDEMEKLSHTFNQVWSKVGLKDKLLLNIFNKKDRIKGMLDSGRQVGAINSINGTLGRPLMRSVKDKPAAYAPELIQKDTYRKPGAF